MARALTALCLTLLLAAGCSAPLAGSGSDAPATGPRAYKALIWRDGEAAPSVEVYYTLDRLGGYSDGQVRVGTQATTWFGYGDQIIIGRAGRAARFGLKDLQPLLARLPFFGQIGDPLDLLDGSWAVGLLGSCLPSKPAIEFDWPYRDPLIADKSLRTDHLSGFQYDGLCRGIPLSGAVMSDAFGRLRLIGLEMPGYRIEWSNSGPVTPSEPSLPAAPSGDDLLTFLGL